MNKNEVISFLVNLCMSFEMFCTEVSRLFLFCPFEDAHFCKSKRLLTHRLFFRRLCTYVLGWVQRLKTDQMHFPPNISWDRFRWHMIYQLSRTNKMNLCSSFSCGISECLLSDFSWYKQKKREEKGKFYYLFFL